jgi:hypothetical protein
MHSSNINNKISNEVYVKRYKEFIRLVRISKMLSKAKIIIHSIQK